MWVLMLFFFFYSLIKLDVLSGEVHVQNTEIVYDCGQSLNPSVDVGQIEGGFIMGLGYFMTESVQFQSDGTLFSNGTWEVISFVSQNSNLFVCICKLIVSLYFSPLFAFTYDTSISLL